MKKYIAKVIDNDARNSIAKFSPGNATTNGAIQIYIEHLMQDIEMQYYPWVLQDKEFTSFIPEINDYVWVWFEDEIYWRNGFYGNTVSLKEYHEHNETIGSITTAYPDVKYIKLANGVAIGLSSNTSTPEISIKHPSCEIFIDKNGKCTVTSSNIVELNASSTVNITSSSAVNISASPGVVINNGALAVAKMGDTTPTLLGPSPIAATTVDLKVN